MVLDHGNSGYSICAKLYPKWVFISIKYLLLISFMNSICHPESELSLCILFYVFTGHMQAGSLLPSVEVFIRLGTIFKCINITG